MKKLLLLTLLLFISGCAGKIFSSDSWLAPRPHGMGKPPEDAPEDYKQGWNDGCETGMSTMVTGGYKSFYEYKMDTSQMQDKVYYQAWKDAYTYCRQYAFRYTWDAVDKVWLFDQPLCIICPNELGRAQ